MLEIELVGDGPPQHIHKNEDETFYVVEGEMKVLLGKRIISAKAGSFVFVPSRLLKKAEKIKILCSWEPFSSFHRPMGLCVGSIFPFSWALDTRLPQRAPAGAARARFRIRIRL